MAVAYELGSRDNFSDVALDMRKLMSEAFKNQKSFHGVLYIVIWKWIIEICFQVSWLSF